MTGTVAERSRDALELIVTELIDLCDLLREEGRLEAASEILALTIHTRQVERKLLQEVLD